MRRHGNLFHQIVDLENLALAYRRAKLGKSNMRGVVHFQKDVEGNLEKIHQLLVTKTFTTSQYSRKTVYEPKERVIYVLPFSPDRIVQHALMNVIVPIWQPMFHEHSYACITGKGIHAGSRQTMGYVRKYRYCLKCDISKFYPSVDHNILMNIIRRKIKCPDTLWLIDDIVNSYPGGKNVPIGNLTSQWFGNLYMNELDQYVKHTLKHSAYIRYCDDFLFFHNDKGALNTIARLVEDYVGSVLKLRLSKCDLFPVSRGVDFLGYRHFRDYILLRKRTAKRVMRRLRQLPQMLDQGILTPEQARSKLASANGWMKWANTYHLQQSLHLKELMEKVHVECTRRKAAAAVC